VVWTACEVYSQELVKEALFAHKAQSAEPSKIKKKFYLMKKRLFLHIGLGKTATTSPAAFF